MSRSDAQAIARPILTPDAESRRSEELAYAVAKQRAVLDALPANVALIEADGRIGDVNLAWEDFRKANTDVFGVCGVGANYLEICDHAAEAGVEHARQAADGIRRVLARELSIFTLEYPSPSPEARRWFQLTVTPLDAPGGGAVAMHIDFSERKKAAAELHFKTTLLEAQSEAAFDGILTISHEGKILGFNRRFAQMWRLPPEEIGALLEDRAALAAVLDQVADPDGFLRKVEWLYAHPEKSAFDEIALRDGRIFDRYTAPIIDAASISHGRVWFFRDITDRRNAERAMESAQRRLLEASRQAGMAEVASNVLHNVGNVLNSVNVAAEQIAEALGGSHVAHLESVAAMLHEHEGDLADFLSTDEQGAKIPGFVSLLSRSLAEDYAAAHGEVQLLRRSVEHIRQVIAVQQDNARWGGVMEPVQLAEVIADALRINAAALEQQSVRVVRELATVPPVLADKHQVLQIIVNLIRNAKEALEDNPAGERIMTIRLEQASKAAVRVFIADNGRGIPAENLPHLFEHGFTTRPRGHGFGLHSAALLAKELGGTLTATSAGWGCGATFTLELQTLIAG